MISINSETTQKLSQSKQSQEIAFFRSQIVEIQWES